MQALLAQLAPVPGEPAVNAARAAEVVAAHPEAELVVLPELFLSGYDLARARETAVYLDGPELAQVRAAAVDPAAHRAELHAECRGDLLVRQTFDVAQDDRGTEFGSEGVQRLLHIRVEVGVVEDLLR